MQSPKEEKKWRRGGKKLKQNPEKIDKDTKDTVADCIHQMRAKS